MVAAKFNQFEIVVELLKHINLKSIGRTNSDWQPRSAFDIAKKNGYHDIYDLIRAFYFFTEHLPSPPALLPYIDDIKQFREHQAQIKKDVT